MDIHDLFDYDYFENGIQTRKSNYQDYSWNRLGTYFAATAKHISEIFKPKKTLDIGTAKGFWFTPFISLALTPMV